VEPALSQRIAVVGGGLGGLGCAALLSAAGHRVTLLEKNAWLGGKCRRVFHRGVVIDTGPAMLTFPQLLNAFNSRWESLSGQTAPLLELVRLDGIGHYCREDMTQSLPLTQGNAGYEDWQAYAIRYQPLSKVLLDLLVTDPRSRAAVAPAMKMIRLLGGSFSLGAWLKRAKIRDGRLHDIIELQSLNAGGNASQVPALFGALLATLATDGVFVPQGGMYGLILHLESLLRIQHVDIRTGYSVTRINNRKVTGPDGEEEFDVVVSGVDPLLTARLTDSPPPVTVKNPLSCSVLGLFGSVKPRISERLPIHQVFMPKDSSKFFSELVQGLLPESSMVFCHNYPLGHPINPDPQHAVMAFLLTIPAAQFSPTRLQEFSDQQCRRVAKLMGLASVLPNENPFKELWLDVPTVLDPAYYGEFGHPSGALYGHLVAPIAAGPFHPVRYQHALRWLWQVGAGVHPGGGIPGTLGGAIIVSEKILGALAHSINLNSRTAPRQKVPLM